jgi:hypothetical protein
MRILAPHRLEDLRGKRSEDSSAESGQLVVGTHQMYLRNPHTGNPDGPVGPHPSPSLLARAPIDFPCIHGTGVVGLDDSKTHTAKSRGGPLKAGKGANSAQFPNPSSRLSLHGRYGERIGDGGR